MSNHPDVPPVSPDRPMVDGTDRSPGDLRAEVEQQNDPRQEDALAAVDRLRDDLGVTVAELTARLDVPSRARDGVTHAVDTAMAAGRAHRTLITVGVGVTLFGVVLRRVRRRG